MFRIPNFLLNQDAVLEPHLGNSAYGDIFGSPQNIKCRFEASNEKMRDNEGNEFVVRGRMFVHPEVEINSESKITFDGELYIAVVVAKQWTINNLSHKEVMLK